VRHFVNTVAYSHPRDCFASLAMAFPGSVVASEAKQSPTGKCETLLMKRSAKFLRGPIAHQDEK
jgi:hypothetical protein